VNINRVILTGNLTKDPEVIERSSTTVCKLRLAVNTRKKNSATGDWEDKPNYFNVTIFGRQAESCGQYLSKGRPVGIDGRLEWSEWEKDGEKRQSVDIIAENVQFLGGREENGRSQDVDLPADTSDLPTPGTATIAVSSDDIPF
jgi:single-strand DNA-binding protein